MIPGFGGRGVNPKKLNAMMRQMGIEMEDIDDVEEVVIRTKDREIVFRDATVSKMTAQGQVTWQVMGTAEERKPAPAEPVKISYGDDDVKLVMEQAHVNEKQARQALDEANGQPAEAILKLLEEDADAA
jgi:nascent polypeptide-associated complex subunit alpha